MESEMWSTKPRCGICCRAGAFILHCNKIDTDALLDNSSDTVIWLRSRWLARWPPSRILERVLNKFPASSIDTVLRHDDAPPSLSLCRGPITRCVISISLSVCSI